MVEKIVSSQVASLSLKQRLTLVDMEHIFQEIRVALEDELSRQPNDFLANVMLPPQSSPEVRRLASSYDGPLIYLFLTNYSYIF